MLQENGSDMKFDVSNDLKFFFSIIEVILLIRYRLVVYTIDHHIGILHGGNVTFEIIAMEVLPN